METNSSFFQKEHECIERWADDLVIAVEKELSDTKAQMQARERQARKTATIYSNVAKSGRFVSFC